LYDAGHYIKLFTARGSRNGLDFRELTESQLKEWGLKYHELIFGKPHADIYVDNNTKTPEEFFGKTDCVRVVVSGGFDPVHIGHLRLFKKAREFGDKLIVILNKDEFILRKKGYVLMPLAERKEILESCKYVDEVVVSIDEDKSVSKTIEMIKPDYFVKSGDRKGEAEREACEKVGCERVYIDFDEETKSHSSSKIVGKVRGITP
jgi:D-beta-D-heptose 7-phosphate kinase/D-beta-D-heptose 1-phosphate adenosyltransferase